MLPHKTDGKTEAWCDEVKSPRCCRKQHKLWFVHSSYCILVFFFFTFRRTPKPWSTLIQSTRWCEAQSGGKLSTLQKSYERNYGWKNHYLINWPSCSELVGNRAYKILMALWGFDSSSLQLSDSSEKCPHPERANFTLLMTWGGVEAINSSYLSAWSLGQSVGEILSPVAVLPSVVFAAARRRRWPLACRPQDTVRGQAWWPSFVW